MPPSTHEARDPRVRRTRQLLQDALRKLLEQKQLDEILVQDIAEAATVNRATFYDHYTDKFDLFNALIGSDFEKLLEARNVCLDGNCSSGLNALVHTVSDFLREVHKDKAVCVRRASSGPLVDAATTLAIRKIVLEGLEKQKRRFSVPREVVAATVGGAIYNAVKESLSRTKQESEEEAIGSIVQLILPLLEENSAGVIALEG